MGRPAPLAQSAEHIHGKDGVGGSIPPGGSKQGLTSGNAGQFPFWWSLAGGHNAYSHHPFAKLAAMDTSASPSLRRSFELHLRAENRADNTIESYLESIRQAEAFLATLGKGLLDADRGDLEAFMADLLARRAASTAASRYKALRILYGWLEEEGEISANPITKMRPPIVPEQPVPVVPTTGYGGCWPPAP